VQRLFHRGECRRRAAEGQRGADRIVIEAHGEHESSSAEGDLEGYAFERRVTVRIEQAADDKAVASLK